MEQRFFEVILGIGLSVIAYFLKLIHADLRALISRVQNQATALAVYEQRIIACEKRLARLEEEV